MVIEVELFGQLSISKQRKQVLNIDHLLCVREVAFLLGLNHEQIGLVTINGVQSEIDDMTSPGCRLCLFPPMSDG